MTANEFLQNLLDQQQLNSTQVADLRVHKNEVSDFLLAAFDTVPSIKYAGSYAKGTMIRDCYDLDVVCYFPSDDERSLKDIRADVSERLSERYLIDEKTSAVRIRSLKGSSTGGDYHVDVVPGRFIEDSTDVFIHLAQSDKERMQTNLKTHIQFVSESGCQEIIRLVKLWATRHNLTIKTFVLELFVVRVLSGVRFKDDLARSFVETMRAFKEDFEGMQLVDPANSNNVVSQLVHPTDKKLIVDTAASTHARLAGEPSLEVWKRLFGVSDTAKVAMAAATRGPTIISNPPRPWSC